MRGGITTRPRTRRIVTCTVFNDLRYQHQQRLECDPAHSTLCTQVASYARRYRYSEADQADVSERLQVVIRLCRQHDCADSAALIAAATQAEASLDTWFRMEGQSLKVEQSPKKDRAGQHACPLDPAAATGRVCLLGSLLLQTGVSAVTTGLPKAGLLLC